MVNPLFSGRGVAIQVLNHCKGKKKALSEFKSAPLCDSITSYICHSKVNKFWVFLALEPKKEEKDPCR